MGRYSRFIWLPQYSSFNLKSLTETQFGNYPYEQVDALAYLGRALGALWNQGLKVPGCFLKQGV